MNQEISIPYILSQPTGMADILRKIGITSCRLALFNSKRLPSMQAQMYMRLTTSKNSSSKPASVEIDSLHRCVYSIGFEEESCPVVAVVTNFPLKLMYSCGKGDGDWVLRFRFVGSTGIRFTPSHSNAFAIRVKPKEALTNVVEVRYH